jgi:hypothetical protein
MPYLNCPNCRLTVYTARRVSAPEDCSRCGAVLGERVPSLFDPNRSENGAFATRGLETLRARAAARSTQLDNGTDPAA